MICLERDIVEPNYTTYINSDNRHRRHGGEFHRRLSEEEIRQARGAMLLRCGACWAWKEKSIAMPERTEVFSKYPGDQDSAEPVADWIQAKAKDRMTEALRAQPKIDVVYAHNDPMAVGAYLAAKELGREKEMIFVGVDGLGGPAEASRK